MPDELPAETGGAVETPNAQPNTDWEKRYTETHAWGNGLSEELAAERKVWEDEQAALGRLQEKFPHLFEEADPDPDPDEYVDPDESERPLTRAEFEAWKQETAQQAQAQSQQQQFETDFQAVLNGREITKHGDRAIRYALNQGEIKNADDLKKAVDEWFDEAGTTKPKPRVPTPPPGGQAATHAPVWGEMTQGEQNRRMAEMVMEREAQT